MSNRRINQVLSISFFLLFTACTSGIEIEGFSSEVWKSGRNGCNNSRKPYAKFVKDSQEELLGRSEHAILKLMGRPDKNELYRRQQKFYIYYLEPGPRCDGIRQASDSASYLSIRFNATGVVNEVFIYE